MVSEVSTNVVGQLRRSVIGTNESFESSIIVPLMRRKGRRSELEVENPGALE